ncbi:MAG: T9SS type A sorting domain-containing protein [Bacteroidota bacterium]
MQIFINQASKAYRHLIAFFFLAIVSISLVPLQAQNPPVDHWFTPAEFESGDELTLHINYGTSSVPVPPTTRISLTFSYEGFDIVSSPYVDLEDSWFCPDGKCEASITYDNTIRELRINVVRTDGNPMEGSGFLARGKGIIVEMDEIQMKKPEQSLQLLSVENISSVQPKLYVDANLQTLKIVGIAADEIQELEILNLSGQQIKHETGTIALEHILPLSSTQIYIVKLKTSHSEGYLVQKIVVR